MKENINQTVKILILLKTAELPRDIKKHLKVYQHLINEYTYNNNNT